MACEYCHNGMMTDPDTLSLVRCTVCGGPTGRIIVWFSCGAASAAAAKIVLGMNRGRRPLVIAYTKVVNEHPDNMRFLADCERWFNYPITILSNLEYGGNIHEVFRRTRYLVGPTGAACTRLLKKDVRKQFQRPDDSHVFGYTAEEQDRLDSFIDANNGVDVRAPLIARGLTKADCLAMVAKAGIELPEMYRLGYINNNCIGCVKGGAGYWNKIRKDFPDAFERMARVEEELGRTINVTRIGGVRKRISLRELDPNAGNYEAEPSIECGIACELAATEENEEFV